jgi:two-component system chemotaxis sensor kinase CheA
MDDYIPNFLAETGEVLAVLNDDLLRLEVTPDDMRLIGGILRTLHNIKGTTGFLGFPELGRVCHAGETVLGQMRDGALRPSPEIFGVLHRCTDAIRRILDNIETWGNEGRLFDDAVIAQLFALHDAGSQLAAREPSGDSAALQALFDATPGPQDPDPATIVAFAPVRRARQASQRADGRASANKVTDNRRTVRIEVDLLDELMATVSELTLARDQLREFLCRKAGNPFSPSLHRLSSITSDLQEIVRKTRLQPVGAAWAALPRLVHGLACGFGKKIELVMEGADAEFDRRILKLIKDPLIHIVRNAADHGLEMPTERLALGKPETGRIRLRTFLEDDTFVIKIEDDGRGLDADRIRRKAIEIDLASKAEVMALTDAEVLRFILRSGFSTAAEVTSVSGRGIGMNIVGTAIEHIGGTIDIESSLGLGTAFVIRLPLKPAIIAPSILGRSGADVSVSEKMARF